jgi:hypothetical protein
MQNGHSKWRIFMISPLDIFQLAVLIIGATGMVQGLPPASIFDFIRIGIGLLIVVADVYLFIVRRRQKKRSKHGSH